MGFVIEMLVKLLDGLPPKVVKVAIDKALDPIEAYLEKDGVTNWEKLLLGICSLIRKGLQITEEEGSEFAD